MRSVATPSPLLRHYNLFPALFFAAGLLSILALTVLRERAQTERILVETGVTADQVRLRLESCVNSRANVITSLATRNWQDRTQIDQEWDERASVLHPLFSSILALNFVDTDGRIQRVYPQEANASALGANLLQNPNSSVIEALTAAREGRGPQRTDIIELLQGGIGFVMYQPIITASGTMLGFVNGVFRLQTLMDSCLSEQPLRNRFTFALLQGNGEIFYQQPLEGYRALPKYEIRTAAEIIGSPWEVRFSPSADYLARRENSLTSVLIALGLILLTLFTLAFRALLQKQLSLRDSEEKYRLLVENQTDMVVQINAANEIVYASPSYWSTFGKTEADMRGDTFLPLVHPDDREHTLQSLARLQRPPHRAYHEQRALTKDGWRWLAWSNTAVLDSDGKVTAITAVGRDVTDVKNLEMRVARAQKMEAVGTMAGGISHDFNNLLQVLLGNIDFLMADNQSNPKLQQELGELIKVIERAMQLTARLSTLSRQDASRPVLFDLNEFADELLALLRRTLPERIRVKLQRAPAPLRVLVDKTQLEQVLLNLCFNARDAITGDGEITIQLDSRPLPSHLSMQPSQGADLATFASIRICDTGSGIPDDVLPRIFDPFFTTKPQGSGTGLGLANCYSIVRRNGGEIGVESVVGSGSVFTVYLPLAQAAAASKTGGAVPSSKCA